MRKKILLLFLIPVCALFFLLFSERAFPNTSETSKALHSQQYPLHSVDRVTLANSGRKEISENRRMGHRAPSASNVNGLLPGLPSPSQKISEPVLLLLLGFGLLVVANVGRKMNR